MKSDFFKMEIYILRHGTTVWNKEHRIQGNTDIPLDPVGVEMARQTGARLREAGIRFDRVWSSPLSRAYETALLVTGGGSPGPGHASLEGSSARELGSAAMKEPCTREPGSAALEGPRIGEPGCTVLTDPRIRELSFGRQEGGIVEEMVRGDVPFRFFKTDPAEYDRLACQDPSMESLTELLRRTADFMRERVEGPGMETESGVVPSGAPREARTSASVPAAGHVSPKGANGASKDAVGARGREAAGRPFRILISGHGAMNRGLLMHIRGTKDLAEFWGTGLQPNCGIDIARYDPETGEYEILEENRIFYDEELLARSGRLL